MKRLKLLAAALAAAASIPAYAVGNLADLKVFDRAAGRELPVYWHEGRAYVVGKPGNEYQLTVRNRAGEDLLAVVSVDGVNIVSGETAATSQGGYVMSGWDALDIKGWRKSLSHTAAFYFTSLGDSYAGRTGRPDNVGVIGVALFKRKWVEPPKELGYSYPQPSRDANRRESPRAAESDAVQSAPSGGASAVPPPLAKSAPLGTGHGRRENSEARYVNFERASDYPVETLTIYYDSYRNLVARGILNEPIGRREPQPFPSGFVADPPAWGRYR